MTQNQNQFQKQLDNLDHQLIEIMARRFELSRKFNSPPLSFDRECFLTEQRAQWGLDHGVNPELARRIFPIIFHFTHNEEL